MKKFFTTSLLFAGLLSVPAIAQDEENKTEEEPIETGWFTTQGGISVHHSGIILPYKLNSLNAVSDTAPKSGSNGLDNIIQYRNADSGLFASIYIYRPSFTDAELTAKMTDNAINIGFGVDGAATVYKTSAFGGNDNGAIILGYDKTDKNLSTAAAFAEVGSWILKIRVSGSEAEFDDVINVMNKALDTIKLDDDISVEDLSIQQPKTCKTGIGGKAKVAKLSKDEALQNSLLSGLLGPLAVSVIEADDGEALEKISYSKWCVAEYFTTNNTQYKIYRTEDSKDSNIIMPFSDTGSVIYTASSPLSDNRNISIYNIGSIRNYSAINGDLSVKQYDALLNGKSKLKIKVESENSIKANGDTNTTLFTL